MAKPPITRSLRSGFVTFVGRPNVGKSTLLNSILGTKVSIVSDKVQTTRTQVRGVLHLPERQPPAQIVFVDTPGLLKPRTLLGERTNEAAHSATEGVDVVCFVIDATAPFGRGDAWVATRVPPTAFLVVNKVDIAGKDAVLRQLTATAPYNFGAYFPVSARSGEGLDVLVDALVERLPEGPPYYPTDMVADMEEHVWVAELVREQLLARANEELPHSIAARVTEWDEREDGRLYVRVEILVERESQKPIVIGKGGQMLKEVGTEVRAQLPSGTYVDLFVRVDKDWQRRPNSLDRLGY